MPEKYLVHYGIKGMKWGKRRFQNKDGSLTPAGRSRYNDDGDDKPHGDLGLKNRARYKPDPKHGYKIDNRVVSFMGSNRQNARSGAQNGHPAMNSAMKDPKGPGYNPGGGGYQSLYSDYRKTDPDKKLSEQDKNFMSSTVKKQQSNRPRQAPGSENVHNTADPRGIQYRNNPQRYGTFERGTNKPIDTNDPRYILNNNAFRVNEQRDPKTGELLWRYRTRKVDGWNNEGTGGATYTDYKTGKKYLVPHGEKVNPVTGKESSASSSQNNPARYGNFEQQKRDAARASKSKAGTKKSSLTTKAKQTISQATQQASQSVQKASDWLKKLFGKK